MMKLPFRANGHETRIADGELIMVFDYDDGLEPFSPDLSFSCGTCDAWLNIRVSDDAATLDGPCPYPDGITTVTTVSFPSGTVIVTDDLRPAYDWRDSERNDPPGMAGYNSALGQHQAVLAMAAQGCAYGYVGNSSPGLYRTGEGTYAIASLDYYPGDGDDELTRDEAMPEGWTLLAGIITDLWAYSIADYESWKARGGSLSQFAQEAPGWDWDLVELPAGTYELAHHTGERSFDRDAPGTTIYAEIRYLEGPS